MEAIEGGLLEGDVADGGGHPRGPPVAPDLEVRFLMDHRVRRRLRRVAQERDAEQEEDDARRDS